MQFTIEMLEILTKRPGGWATLDELSREKVTARRQGASSRFSELCDVDVLEAGLVVEENNGLRITEAGRSVLQALEALNGPEPEPEVISSETSSDLASEPETVVDLAGGTVEGDHLGNARETDIPTAISINLPAFLNVQGEATIKAPIRPRSRNHILAYSVASSLKRFTRILRGHIEQDPPKIKPGGQSGGIGGVIFTVLVLLAIIICVGTVIAINQIRSLKSEIMTLERQLAPLKKQADNAEQQEKRNSPEEMNAALKALATDKSKPTDESHSPSTTLTLSRVRCGLSGSTSSQLP